MFQSAEEKTAFIQRDYNWLDPRDKTHCVIVIITCNAQWVVTIWATTFNRPTGKKNIKISKK